MASEGPAYRTISDVATLIGVPQHVLRFWETKFPQVAPLKRGGNRRYYRPEDIATLTTIARLLHSEGYTIKGVQKLLDGAMPAVAVSSAAASPAMVAPAVPKLALAAIRASLADALAAARAI